jgi:signal transduction histidine kinase
MLSPTRYTCVSAPLVRVNLSFLQTFHHAKKKKIDRLRELDRLKDHFLGIISHELRTPLNAVSGFGSVLMDGLIGPLTPAQSGYVEKMLAGTDTLLGLIDDLLDMSRLQAGKFSIEPAPFELRRSLPIAVDTLRNEADREGHRLKLEIANDLPLVHADERRVVQVVLNFLTNAIKYTPGGGVLTVSACRVEEGIRIAVADTGPGIDESEHERLFQPFVQLDASATRPRGGTGLGLSICKGLVEAHGGNIGLESALGCGTTFWFTLPVPSNQPL